MRAGLFGLVCAAALVLPAPGALAADTWAGTWDSDFGRLTLDAGGSGSYTGFNPGTVSGAVTGNVNKGTWTQPGNPTKSGTFEWTMSAGGQSFSGVWAYDGGGCGTACGWSGRCVAGACLENGKPSPAPAPPPTPAPPAAPRPSCAGAARAAQTAPLDCAPVLPISSATTLPLIGKLTAFRGPAPGKAGSVPLPKVGNRSFELTGQLTFVDDKGQVLPPPPVAAVEERAEQVGLICSMLLIDALTSSNPDQFTACVATVSQILARNDQIKRRRARAQRAGGSSPGVAAQRGCATRIARRGKAVSRLRVSCVRTATGVRVTIRPRSSNQTLRTALRGRTPKLIIGRSSIGPHGAGDRLNVLWKATNLSLL